MKKTDLVKFSLTLVSAAVLAACSSGKSSKPSIPSQPEPEQTQPENTQPETPVGVTNQQPESVSGLSYGHKLVEKKVSNLLLGHADENVTTKTSTTSLAPTAMTTALDPSLDTVVVASSNFQDRTTSAYVEDFDFRTTDGGVASNASGEATLAHIHLEEDGKTSAKGGERTSGLSRTKTANQGEGSGKALVFHANRAVYISTDETELDGEFIEAAAGQDARRSRADTVAEVYGNRTFLEGNSAEAQPKELIENTATLNNLPYAKAVSDNNYDHYIVADKLEFVQYGRVTTKLDGVRYNDLREGVKIFGGDNIRIASYGKYGKEGTENHYFYRSNVNSRGALDVNALQAVYRSNVVNYNGHAVTYGLDHSIRNTGELANAVGIERKLVSGTHVTATVDLTSGDVTGNLYDVWYGGQAGREEYKPNQLVTFNGRLNLENGSIVGTSTLRKDNSTGTLHANLFGSEISELGGAVKSNIVTPVTQEGDQGSWGAVFGAKAFKPNPSNPPTPPTPPGALFDSTDGKNATAANARN